MKVLIVNAYSGHGSTGRIVESIADIIESHGDQAYIAYGYYKSKHKNTIKLKAGGRYHALYEIMKCRITGYFGYTSSASTYRLIHWIKKNKPDIINLHNIHGGYVHISLLAKYLQKAGIPIVWTLHDCWTFTGHCTHFQLVKCDRWKTECFDCPNRALKKNYPISYFFDRSKEQYRWKKADFSAIPNVTMVTPSCWLEGQVKQSFFKQSKFLTIHNGIDLDVFRPTDSICKARLGCEGKKMVLAVAAGWGNRKGLDYVYELSKRLPRDEYQVVIVGLKDKQMDSVPEGVIGIKRTNSTKELAQLYSAADVMVNPTLEDTYPTVNLEAIACGTPVVTFRTGGSPESITAETGAVVDQHDMDSLVRETITWAHRNVKDICRQYALDNFSAANCFDAYYDLFVKLFQNSD